MKRVLFAFALTLAAGCGDDASETTEVPPPHHSVHTFQEQVIDLVLHHDGDSEPAGIDFRLHDTEDPAAFDALL